MARKTGKINARDTFYIITNGERSEKNYFDLLKSYKSIYDVKVEYENRDPLGLVEFAVRYRKDANQVWCVFDIDASHKEERLIPAIKLAEEHNIKYAFSNLAFEVWLISHFQVCDKCMNCSQHKALLDLIIKNELKLNQEYDKADKDLLEKYFVPKYSIAVENTKKVHQKFMKDHKENFGGNSRPRIWEWNSCTTVYKLVEALKLQKKL